MARVRMAAERPPEAVGEAPEETGSRWRGTAVCRLAPGELETLADAALGLTAKESGRLRHRSIETVKSQRQKLHRQALRPEHDARRSPGAPARAPDPDLARQFVAAEDRALEHVEERDRAVQPDREPRREQGAQRRDRVDRHAGHERTRDARHRALIGVGGDQAPAARRVEPEQVVEHRHQHHRQAVDECGRLRVVLEMLGEHAGRERHERDQHQEDHVDRQERPVDAVDAAEDRVVVDPHDPDRHERERVGRVGRPDVQEAVRDARRPSGRRTSRISSVAAIAKTPSLNVSSRVVSIARD